MKVLTARVVALCQAWVEKGPQGPIEDALYSYSLEPGEEEVTTSWDLEISRRVEEIRSGRASGVPAEEVFAKWLEWNATMSKETRDALKILDRLTGDDPELREMIAEERAAAEQELSELSNEQQDELAQALAEADRGEGIDGWQFLEELRHAPLCPARDSHS